jgi:hypothetical protein
MYWAMEADSRRNGGISILVWIALGMVAVGITLTNVAPCVVLLVAALHRRREPWPRIAAITTSAAVLMLAVNVASLFARAEVKGYPGLGADVSRTTHWIHSPTGHGTAEVAWSMAHTFVAPMPAIVSDTEPEPSNPDYDFHFLYPATFEHGLASWWRALVTLLMLGLGAAGYLCRREARALLLPAALIIGGNFLLHVFYGHYYFLYGLHWQFSMVWVMAGIAFLPGRARQFATGALTLFLLITAANSWILMRALLAQLRTS